MLDRETVGDKRPGPEDVLQLDKARSKNFDVRSLVEEFQSHIRYFYDNDNKVILSLEFSGQALDTWLTQTCDRIQKLSKSQDSRDQATLLRNINIVYNASMFDDEFKAEAAQVSNLIVEMGKARPAQQANAAYNRPVTAIVEAKTAAAEATATAAHAATGFADPVFSDADIAATAAEEQYVESQARIVVEKIPVVPFVIARWFCAKHVDAAAAIGHILEELFHYNTDPQNYLVVTSFLSASTPSGNPDDAKLSRDYVALVLMFKDFRFDEVMEFINKMGNPEIPLSEAGLTMQMARLQGVGAERMAELVEIAAGTQTPAPQLSVEEKRALLCDCIAARLVVLQQALDLGRHAESDINDVQLLLAIADDPDCVKGIVRVSTARGWSHAEALRRLSADDFDVERVLQATAAGGAGGGSGASGGKGKERMGS